MYHDQGDARQRQRARDDIVACHYGAHAIGTRWSIVGVVAVCYGFLISFGLRGVAPATKSRVVLVGAAVILILAVALVLLPLLKVY